MASENIKDNITFEIRHMDGARAVKAYADVTFRTPAGTICMRGFAIVEKDGKAPFVGLPSKQGNVPGKYFKTIELDGPIQSLLPQIVLEEYAKSLD